MFGYECNRDCIISSGSRSVSVGSTCQYSWIREDQQSHRSRNMRKMGAGWSTAPPSSFKAVPSLSSPPSLLEVHCGEESRCHSTSAGPARTQWEPWNSLCLQNLYLFPHNLHTLTGRASGGEQQRRRFISFGKYIVCTDVVFFVGGGYCWESEDSNTY